MNASPRFRPKAAPDTPLFTMADVDLVESELRQLKAEQADDDREHQARRDRRQNRITTLELRQRVLLEAAREKTAALEQGAMPTSTPTAPPETPPSAETNTPGLPLDAGPAIRRGPQANSIVNEIAEKTRQMAVADGNRGFRPWNVRDMLDHDETVSAATKAAHPNTIYSVLKFMRLWGIAEKRGSKYFLTEKGMQPPEPRQSVDMDPEPIEAFKKVPLTQREHARIIARKMIEKAGQPVHCNDISKHLIKAGVFPPTMNKPGQRVSQYMCDWPEFVSDGNGYYVIIPENLPADE